MTASHDDFGRALSAAQDGDSGGFARLWHLVNPALLRYLQITAPETAMEVASATWVTIGVGIRSFRGERSHFVELLVRIARDESAQRLRTRRRRPDAIIDRVQLAAAERAAAQDASVAVELSTTEAIRMVATLPADVAEMVALRVVAGLDAVQTAAVLTRRAGAVRVAVHSGLRRTGALAAARAASTKVGTATVGTATVGTATVGTATVATTTAPGLVLPNPWALDRLLDGGPGGLAGLDPSMRRVVCALRAPAGPGDLSALVPAQAAFERNVQRAFAFSPALLLPFLLRRLGAARVAMTGKVAAVALGTVVLSAPAAAAYSAAGPDRSSGPSISVSAAARPAGRVRTGHVAPAIRIPMSSKETPKAAAPPTRHPVAQHQPGEPPPAKPDPIKPDPIKHHTLKHQTVKLRFGRQQPISHRATATPHQSRRHVTHQHEEHASQQPASHQRQQRQHHDQHRHWPPHS
jgi:RNA polymerase sigma-70 factor, ECF subfamily